MIKVKRKLDEMLCAYENNNKQLEIVKQEVEKCAIDKKTMEKSIMELTGKSKVISELYLFITTEDLCHLVIEYAIVDVINLKDGRLGFIHIPDYKNYIINTEENDLILAFPKDEIIPQLPTHYLHISWQNLCNHIIELSYVSDISFERNICHNLLSVIAFINYDQTIYYCETWKNYQLMYYRQPSLNNDKNKIFSPKKIGKFSGSRNSKNFLVQKLGEILA